MKKYYGNYLVGLQSHWVAFAAMMGIDVQTLMPHARRSINQVAGEYIWLLELWDLTFAEEKWAYDNGIYPLRQFQASQLGIPFNQVRGKDGQRILTDQGALIPGREKQAILWGRTLHPAMPWGQTNAQLLQYMQ